MMVWKKKKKKIFFVFSHPGGSVSFPGVQELGCISGKLPDDPRGFTCMVGFHGNRKRPLTYNGENDVSTFSLLIVFKLAGNEDRHKILNEYEFQPDQTIPYRVRCP